MVTRRKIRTILSNIKKLIKKLIKKFRSVPADFKYAELKTLLEYLGYEESNSGKTSGSRVRYIHPDLTPILIHKPHPGSEMKKYIIRELISKLEERGQL